MTASRFARVLFAAAIAAGGVQVAAQQAKPATATTPRSAARIDLTGYWVSYVTEDWRFRMITPPKGDYRAVPLTAEGRKTADAWDPAADARTGNECKAYGAAAIMRMPGRLHITWQDDTTLKIETDAGTQTRLLHFGGKPPANEAPSWQGYSSATWEEAPPIPSGLPIGLGPRLGLRSRSLEVKTTNLRAGYLRKNGVPYSVKTTVTEYFERFPEPNGDDHLMVMTIVTDPEYLAVPFVTTTDFKREPDGSKWDPSPCTAR